MAHQFWGFDFAAPADQGWTGDLNRSTSTVRTGSHSLLTGGIGASSPTFDNDATIYVGGAVRWTYLQAGEEILQLFDGATAQLTVTLESDNSLKVRRGGDTGTVLASSAAGLFSANVWHHLQLGAVIHGSTGSVELKLNGTTIASASGVNTSNSGNAYVNKIKLLGPDGSNTAFWDDVWKATNAFQGDCAVETLYPSANGSVNNFSVSGAASNYQAVDETGTKDDDTTYTYGANVGDKDLFAMANSGYATGTIKAVQAHVVMRKDDAGTREAAMVLRQSSTESTRATQALTTSFVIYSEAFTTDPTDSVAWTISKVNSLEVGVKIIT